MSTPTYPSCIQRVIDTVCTQTGNTLADERLTIFNYATATSCAVQPVALPPAGWQAYLNKVIHHAYRIADTDTAQLQACGHSEDTIFELTVVAALGAGLARLECGLTALQKVKGVSDEANDSH